MTRNPLLEELVELFDVDEDLARLESNRIRSEDFDECFTSLESRFGFNFASEIVRRGRILNHIGRDFRDYMNLAIEVHNRIGHLGIEHARIFENYSSLQNYLTGEITEGLDFSSINLANYRILHHDNSQSVQYLDNLIQNRYLSFGISEHWAKSNSVNGPRGAAIAKRIGFEINRIFDDLGLPRPSFDVNFGQRSIEIDEETAEILRLSRNEAYSRYESSE